MSIHLHLSGYHHRSVLDQDLCHFHMVLYKIHLRLQNYLQLRNLCKLYLYLLKIYHLYTQYTQIHFNIFYTLLNTLNKCSYSCKILLHKQSYRIYHHLAHIQGHKQYSIIRCTSYNQQGKGSNFHSAKSIGRDIEYKSFEKCNTYSLLHKQYIRS
jgi:hypothetical protein